MQDWNDEDDPFHLAFGARHLHKSALFAANECIRLKDKWRDGDTKYAWTANYIAFWCSLKASVESLKKADGKRNRSLLDAQSLVFEDQIKGSAVFKIITDERHKVAHGDLGVAYHPEWPLDVLRRHLESGSDFGSIVFSFPDWPDGPFRGQSLLNVMQTCLSQVESWIDLVDLETGKTVGEYPGQPTE